MKLDKLETHDRLLEYNKQAEAISQGCMDCIKNRPKAYAEHPFYIFAHCRTHENGYTKRLIWEPRLSKPKAQTNSMLFMYVPAEKMVHIIWMIPAREQWGAYDHENMLADDISSQSIRDFQFNRKKLEKREPQEIEEELKPAIMKEVGREALAKRNEIKRLMMLHNSNATARATNDLMPEFLAPS